MAWLSIPRGWGLQENAPLLHVAPLHGGHERWEAVYMSPHTVALTHAGLPAHTLHTCSTQVVEFWGNTPGDGCAYYVVRPPWVANDRLQTFFTLHPEVSEAGAGGVVGCVGRWRVGPPNGSMRGLRDCPDSGLDDGERGMMRLGGRCKFQSKRNQAKTSGAHVGGQELQAKVLCAECTRRLDTH